MTGLAPSDMVAALRSFPRRFRELFDLRSEEDDDEAVEIDPSAGIPYVVSAAATLSRAYQDLDAILVREKPTLGGSAAAGEGRSLDEALLDVDASASQLADRVDRVGSDEWSRTGTSNNEVLSAHDVVQRAIDGAVADLRAAANAVRH